MRTQPATRLRPTWLLVLATVAGCGGEQAPRLTALPASAGAADAGTDGGARGSAHDLTVADGAAPDDGEGRAGTDGTGLADDTRADSVGIPGDATDGGATPTEAGASDGEGGATDTQDAEASPDGALVTDGVAGSDGGPGGAQDTEPDAALDGSAGACPVPTATAGDPLRVLFLGNSYTSVNDLPGTFRSLATSTGHAVVVDSYAPGGYTLAAPPNDHADDPATLAKIAAGPWHVVVLQEQSQLPTIPPFLEATTIPGATSLDAAVHAAHPCARTVLYLTWGRKDGGQQCAGNLCSPPFADFAAMQTSLTAAYTKVAAAIGAEIAPVGPAWLQAMADAPAVGLFAGDGSHPSKAGTYLAASVFHAALLGDSPVGATYTGDVGVGAATALQAVAGHTVLDDPEAWNLPW